MIHGRDQGDCRENHLRQPSPDQAPDAESHHRQDNRHGGITDQITAGVDEELFSKVELSAKQRACDDRDALHREPEGQEPQDRRHFWISHDECSQRRGEGNRRRRDNPQKRRRGHRSPDVSVGEIGPLHERVADAEVPHRPNEPEDDERQRHDTELRRRQQSRQDDAGDQLGSSANQGAGEAPSRRPRRTRREVSRCVWCHV